MFNQLDALDTSRTTWKIKTRVTRMWPSISNQSVEGKESLKGYNLILLDEDNSHVQAFVYADTWKQIADKIDEGGLYVISNFYTKQALGSMKPISSKILINFSPNTTVEKVLEDDLMIPLHKFEFVDLDDLLNIANAYVNPDFPEFSTDIIGVVEDYEPISDIKTIYGQKKIVRFRITDGRNHHKISVWDDLAVKTEASYNKAVERPIIAIVTSTKLKIYKNSVQISTLPSSKVYLNLDCDYVVTMRQRLEEEGYTVSQQDVQTPSENVEIPVMETLTLKELGEKQGNEYIKKEVYCNIKIQNVEEINWWYNSCPECEGETHKQDGLFKCSNCTDKTVPVPEKKYRIVVLGEDSTEAYNFILMDRAARRMLSMTATKMISQTDKAKAVFPHRIKEMSGKEVKLKIKITDDNIKSNSNLYYAVDAYDICKTSSSKSVATFPTFPTSESGENNVVLLSDFGNTPQSAKSTNKKIKTKK